jgi:hypothetical protein
MRRRHWIRRSAWPVCLILALAFATGPRAQQGGAASGSFRAAQDAGRDFSLRPVDLVNLAPGRAPAGSFRAAQGIGAGAGWSALTGYDGPGVPPPWAGGRERPLGSGAQRF